ncbi:MAG: hypothetical protein LQ350_006129 [Teloschistes chrysophthalmus]|nr:MAG: hypothetical protein LQ350_006129 [Niorma chrysophthalma]
MSHIQGQQDDPVAGEETRRRPVLPGPGVEVIEISDSEEEKREEEREDVIMGLTVARMVSGGEGDEGEDGNEVAVATTLAKRKREQRASSSSLSDDSLRFRFGRTYTRRHGNTKDDPIVVEEIGALNFTQYRPIPAQGRGNVTANGKYSPFEKNRRQTLEKKTKRKKTTLTSPKPQPNPLPPPPPASRPSLARFLARFLAPPPPLAPPHSLARSPARSLTPLAAPSAQPPAPITPLSSPPLPAPPFSASLRHGPTNQTPPPAPTGRMGGFPLGVPSGWGGVGA